MIPFPFQTGGLGYVSAPSAGAGGGAVTWNPTDKSGQINLSNGDLTGQLAPPGSAFESVRATLARSTGKWYFEIRFDSTGTGNGVIGLASSALTLAGGFIGGDSASWGYYQATGQKLHNNAGATFGTAFPGPEVIGVAWDADAGKVWFAKANVWQASGDPAAGTNEAFSSVTGTLFPAGSLYDANALMTARFKAADLTYSPPSGFSAWET